MARVIEDRKALTEKAEKILEALGVTHEDAAKTIDVLVDADMRGIESHGLVRLKLYVEHIVKGAMKPKSDINVTFNGATALVDGDNGLGQVVTMKALDTVLKIAKQYGIGCVAVRNSNHFGPAGYYTRKMAEAGYVGFITSMAGPTTAPFGGLDKLLGTNPFSIAFPAEKQVFCADMATSAAAKGKVRIYSMKGESIPLGWALDKDGNDTTDPEAALKGILLPMGGHKGYCIALAVDALSALLSGACLSCESSPVSKLDVTKPANTGHFLMAVDISRFLPLEQFEKRAQAWFEKLKASTPRNGATIMIPGEPEDFKLAETGDDKVSLLQATADMVDAYYKKYVG